MSSISFLLTISIIAYRCIRNCEYRYFFRKFFKKFFTAHNCPQCGGDTAPLYIQMRRIPKRDAARFAVKQRSAFLCGRFFKTSVLPFRPAASFAKPQANNQISTTLPKTTTIKICKIVCRCKWLRKHFAR